ncbi:MAG: lysylphosphatidylglycerol synthase transmembrane domain-containing protein [Nanoarchaeota archaeon]|nr:lysylphosphatidylglycerol synthase transmembrane domain-containing protein [Nanoarchaeota archaeon]
MKYKKRTFAVLISIVILFFLFRIIDFSDIISGLEKLPFEVILLSGFFYTLSYVFRTIRFKTLNKGRISFMEFFPIVCMHNFFVCILPARTGELSYVYFLRKRKIPLEQAISTLIVARVLDILVMLVIVLLTILFINKELSVTWVEVFFPVIILISIISVPFLILKLKERFVNVLMKLLLMLNLKKKIINRITKKTGDSIESLKLIKSKGIFIKSIISTFLIIFSQFGFYYLILYGVGIGLSLSKIIGVVIIAVVMSLIPIQGIVGIGTYEGIWAISLIFAGITKEVAVTTSFVMHIMNILFFAILGLLGFLLQLYIKKLRN